MEETPAVEQRQSAAQRTEDTAPGTIDHDGSADECDQDPRFQPTHQPTVAGKQSLDRVRKSGLERAGRAKATDRNRLFFIRNASSAEDHRQREHEPDEHDVANVSGPARQRDLPVGESAQTVLDESEGTRPAADQRTHGDPDEQEHADQEIGNLEHRREQRRVVCRHPHGTSE